MEEAEADTTGRAPPHVLGNALQEDTAEYMLFWFSDGHKPETTVALKPRTKLDQLRKSALQLSESLTKDYIWQRDAFDLQVVSRNGLLYLCGQTSYGDCVEDEWLIAYMLRQLTKSFPGSWARICDNDGEFLLIEGAKAVPSWITPEIDANRVWIHDGMLKVIPPEAIKAAGVSLAGLEASLTLADAVKIIREHPESLVRLPPLENEVFRRLEKYPENVTSAIHYARLILPRKIAYILHSRPRAVAAAVEAFSSRDPLTASRVVDLAHSKTPLQFSPDDLVVVGVKFTRVLFAQLRGQRFTPPKTWPALFVPHAEKLLHLEDREMEDGEDALLKEKFEIMVELSMKLTFGFEIMASSAETSNSRVVREVGLILEDLAEDGDDIAVLPSNTEIMSWPDVNRETDDAWLNINFEDFERELGGGHQSRGQNQTTRDTSTGSNEPGLESGFGDSNVQTDLRRIVSQFQAFMNDTDAGIDGADLGEMDRDNDDDDDDDDEDEDSENSEDDEDGINFDEEEFSRLLRETMGLPPISAAPTGPQIKPNKGKEVDAAVVRPSSTQDGREGVEYDEEGILKLAAQFEAELRGQGALKLEPPNSGKNSGSSSLKSITADGETKNNAVGSELESDDEEELDVDFNLAKNLLESFKGQEGMSGPAGNILSMLGVALPRDEDDDEEKDK